ncbi:MAG: NTP transferase domain-containing protein [Atopobiaceae bacterium]
MKPCSHVWLDDEEGKRFFGPGPFELLRRTERTGSLLAASKQMGMAYTKATRLVSHAEEALSTPLLKRRAGGSGGGGSTLTPEGRLLLERYEAWANASRAASNEFFDACFAGHGGVRRLGCVVMASGEAKRFGRQKLLEPLAGVPVVERTLRAVLETDFDVVVSSRWEDVRQLASGLGAQAVDPKGPLQSDTVRAGVEALGRRAGYLFVQGDQPLVRPQSLRDMAEAFGTHPQSVVRLAWQGQVGSPVLFPGGLELALRALRGDVGGGSLLRSLPELQEGAVLVEAADASELMDIDTPHDLDRIAQVIEGSR